MKIQKLDSIDKIPAGNYEGYYWCSGAKKTIEVNGFSFQPELDKESLFIQEAMLWDKEKKISVMIQYSHRQLITLYTLNNLSEADIEKNSISYIGHRLDNKRLKFFRFWQEEPDPLCNGMSVLKMKAQIFVGFDNLRT